MTLETYKELVQNCLKIIKRTSIKMTEYQLIFTLGYLDDIDSLSKELRCDVLILDASGKYYNLQFITVSRLTGEFDKDQICYFEDNLVILHKVTKQEIVKSISCLHKKAFYKKLLPLTPNRVSDFYPKEDWDTISIIVGDK